MIDLHSHILPGIDDGSENPEMSRVQLSLLRQQGVETVVATPHFYAMQDTPETFLLRRAEAAQRLVYDPADAPQILLGAEVAYFDGMSHTMELERLQLGDSGLLLVEMPFGPWTSRVVQEICQLSALTGLTPVLAHVNRYRRADQLPKYQKELLRHGILFQCNAEAFLSLRERHWALGMLRQGQIHFLGSDTHNLTNRAPNMGSAVHMITQKLGVDALEVLTNFSKEILK